MQLALAKAPAGLVAILGDSRLHHDNGVICVAVNPVGGQIASGSNDRTVRVWDAGTGRLALPLLYGHGTVFAVAFSPDGTLLAFVTSGDKVYLCDAATGRLRHTQLEGHKGWVSSVAFSPDGTQLASASLDQTVRLWDTATGKEARVFKAFEAPMHGVAFSSDGKWLVTGSADGTCHHPEKPRGVKVWDITTEQEVLPLEEGDQAGWCVAVSPGGKYLAAGSHDGTVRIWDARTGRKVHTLRGHTEGVKAVAFSPQGDRLASAGFDGIARVWDMATGQPVAPGARHNWYHVTGVSFSQCPTITSAMGEDDEARSCNSTGGARGAVGAVPGPCPLV